LSKEIKPELPAFEWQVTEETVFQNCLPTPPEEEETLTPPEDAILGNTDRRRKSSSLVRGHLRSPTNVESGRIRLMQIIDEENSRKNFRDYLVSRYCEENLDFYMDILKFHSQFKNEHSNVEEIISAANHIWNEYLDPDTSSKPLNVPQELLNQCKQKISNNSFTVDLFDKLQQHCFDLMLQDSLPKFKRNSMAIPPPLPLSDQQNSSLPLSFLRPPSFVGSQPSLRKSISSGSLRAKMNAAMASLKSVAESTSQNSNDTYCHITPVTSNTSTSINSPPLSPIPLQSSSTSIISSVSSTAPSTPTTPTLISNPNNSNNYRSDTILTSADKNSTAPANRISMASAVCIQNITKRMLMGRRNSTSSTSSQFSVSALSSVFYLSSLDKFRNMPGSYPCKNNNKDDTEDLNLTSWQRLRRNISTPNFQSRSMTKSRPSTLFNTHNQTYNTNKTLPELPT
jgi:hypothetical protein